MKLNALMTALALLLALPFTGTAQETLPTVSILPTLLQKADEADPANRDYRFLWRTDPGVRYQLQTSDELGTWTPVPGYPKEAEGPVEFYDLTPGPGGKKFIQATRLDEQAPVIVGSNPADGAFGVRRFSDLTVVLDDFTEIDPATIQLTIGSGAPLTLAGSPALTFQDNILTYDVVDSALGIFGEEVTFSLTLGDTLGNSTSHTLTCEIEEEAELSVDPANLFVFGSAVAQRAGQRLSARQRVVARAIVGPVRLPADDGDTYELSQILGDRLMLTFDGNAPVFAVDQIVTNTAPADPDEVFYRRITSLATSGNSLTLMTQTLTLKDVVEAGTISLSDQSVILPTGAAPARRVARSKDGKHYFDTLTFDDSGWEVGITVKDLAGVDLGLKVVPNDVFFSLTPYVEFEAEIGSGTIPRVRGSIGGDFDFRMVYNLEASGSLELFEKTIFKLSDVGPVASFFTYLGNVGLLPVFGGIEADFEIEITGDIEFATSVKLGVNRSFNAEAGIGFPGNQDLLKFNSSKQQVPVFPNPSSLRGKASVEVKAIPRVSFLLYKAVGVSMGFYPYFKADYETVTADSGAESSADLTYGWKYFAEVVDTLDVIEAKLEGDLGDPTEINLFGSDEPRGEPMVTHSAAGVNVGICYVPGTILTDTPLQTYLWYGKNPIPGTGNEASLTLPSRTYQEPIRVIGTYRDPAGQAVTVESTAAAPLDDRPLISSEFALIPAGSFQMGDPFAEGWDDERPVHTVNVSAFYMAKYETTKELWDSVRTWGVSNGYTDLRAGNGSYASKGANHPVHSVSWYDIVKWCNARSQKEGLTPCYTVGGAVFKTGVDSTVACNFSASGYRLPTEAEWEKAARGGLSGKRFPWGDTISHSQANYNSRSEYSYDVSPTRGPHPTWSNNDDRNFPYSSPVGSFAPNGYGLYDMAGNMWEWCWDWWDWGYYVTSPASDPRGPTTTTHWYRVYRGGSLGSAPYDCRSAYRDVNAPPPVDVSYGYDFGFRMARSSVPQ